MMNSQSHSLASSATAASSSSSSSRPSFLSSAAASSSVSSSSSSSSSSSASSSSSSSSSSEYHPRSALFCFDPGHFQESQFDAVTFISNQLSSGSDLQLLYKDLQIFNEELKGQLIELLNREYTDFIALASNLVGTSESIQTISVHLSQLRARIYPVYEALLDARKQYEAKLAEKQQIMRQLAGLEMLYSAQQAIQSIGDLLSSIQQQSTATASSSSCASSSSAACLDHFPASHSSFTSDSSKTRKTDAFAAYMQLLDESMDAEPSYNIAPTAVLLERVARQLCRLKSIISSGSEYEALLELKEDVNQLDRRFEKQLEVFTTRLQAQTQRQTNARLAT
eukprot:TRINITY_DN3227_c0_g1_i1.p1 TRINITY_DN3227_c0_g1~~TRINITY_DN3227_c0_g1_i1.p1  ORF type:complete len:346 (-),score=121.41 TRINITY_DN3227_c0_g1_i1:342-1355(-)